MKTKFLLTLAVSIIAIYTNAQAPVITSFSPPRGAVGTVVTITGTDLSTPSTFIIGGTPAVIISSTATSLVGMVMPGAATGSISVTTAGGTATSSGLFYVRSTVYPRYQQGTKLQDTSSIGQDSRQGSSVSISADGNTAIVGEYSDNNYLGGSMIYTRNNGSWAPQGSKLLGTGIAGTTIQQGNSVSISADGNTAIVGGSGDNSGIGAAWIYTRSNGVWAQQGNKLVGTGRAGLTTQGLAVAISADGNTAIVGGPMDNNSIGAVWIYTRSGTTWTQQGNKLVGTGYNAGSPLTHVSQGCAVALSADGNTAIVGGNWDNNRNGAVWIFTRSGSTWTQQGSKLVGTGSTGMIPCQGTSVALSADGNTAIFGGQLDSLTGGAVWVFTRSGTTWTQQGSKLVATDAVNFSSQYTALVGSSVTLSADGNTALVGGPHDDGGVGAQWVFTRTGTSWAQVGSKMIGSGAVGNAGQGNAVSLSADGSTSILGGHVDYSYTGAAWVYVADTVDQCLHADSSGVSDSIYASDLPYVWNGLTFSGAGTQTAHLTNSQGCDSLISLTLIVLPTAVNAINEINENSSIQLYPNPNKGTFTLLTSNYTGASYTITDMLGHIVSQGAVSHDHELIDLKEAAEGVYVIKVTRSAPTRFVVTR